MSSHAAHKLSALFVKKTNEPGKYSDGLGLYLIVEPTGSKRWEQRLTIKGKRCDLGLGSTKLVTLEEARITAQSSKKTFEYSKFDCEVASKLVYKGVEF